jgi:DNA end-binding protein Ku
LVDPHAPVGRAIWSGSISFGLVNVPVEFYTATRRGGVSLRMLGPSGTPLERQYVCPVEDKPLSNDEIERGFEVRPDEFVIVTEEELEALSPGRSRDIAVDRFVPRQDIHPAFFDRSYFLVPGGAQARVYALFADILESSGRAGIGHVVMRGRSYAVAIFAERGILRAEILRYGDEVRSAGELQLPKPPRADRKKVAAMLRRVKALEAGELEPAELRNGSAERLLALARRKHERGEQVVRVPEAAAGEETNVVDLVALLRKRMEGRRRAAKSRPARGRTARRTSRRAPSRGKRAARRAQQRARQ